MITAHANRTVETNVGESSAFKIKATGKAFKVLINGLYANKIQSITREIWSNAFDAHAMAGNADKPFDVTFPNAFNPEFRVRDYGTGLSHHDVMNLYSTIFESTKEGTNEQVGKLGLGSKSPFAYTDTFAVTVWMDGEKRYYAAVIAGDGVPTINHMGTEATDEPNGLEVSFPVNPRDVREFRNAAHRVSLGFDVKPNVLNTDDFKAWRELTPIMTGNGWKLFSGPVEEYGSAGAYAHMGCVLYPLDKVSLMGLSEKASALLSSNFIIDFAIGDLEITASRENLSYGKDEPTADSVVRRLTEVYDELLAEYTGKYDKFPTYHAACAVYAADVRSAHIPSVVRNIINANATWNGQKLLLTKEVPYIRGLNIKLIDEDRLDHKVVRPSNVPDKNYNTTKATAVILYEDYGTPLKRLTARITQVARSGKYKQILLVAVYQRHNATTAVHTLMETFEGFDFIPAEEIELPVTVRKERAKVRLRYLTTYGIKVETADMDFPDDGIYIPMERNELVWSHTECGAVRLLMLLEQAGARVPTVWCVPKSLLKYVDDDWTSFLDWAVDWVNQSNFDVDEKGKLNEVMRDIARDSVLDTIRRRLSYLANPLIQDAVALATEAKAYKPVETEPQTRLLQALCMSPPVSANGAAQTKLNQYNDLLEKIDENYPMLGVFAEISFPSDKAVDKMSAYVAFMDSQNHIAPLSIAA
jgi:hypothetical protein